MSSQMKSHCWKASKLPYINYRQTNKQRNKQTDKQTNKQTSKQRRYPKCCQLYTTRAECKYSMYATQYSVYATQGHHSCGNCRTSNQFWQTWQLSAKISWLQGFPLILCTDSNIPIWCFRRPGPFMWLLPYFRPFFVNRNMLGATSWFWLGLWQGIFSWRT